MRVASGEPITTMVVAHGHTLYLGGRTPPLHFTLLLLLFFFSFFFFLIVFVLKSEGYYMKEDRKFITSVARNQFSIQIDSKL